MFKKLLSFLVVLLLVLASITVLNKVIKEEISSNALSSNDKLKDAVVLYVGSFKAMKNGGETSIDTNDVTVVPYVKNGRTLVPVRFVSEVLGANVSWEEATKTVSVELNGKKIELVIGSNVIKVDGKVSEMETAAEISSDRTFVPLRVLAEAVGKEVFYDRGLIIISNYENIFDPKESKTELDEIIARVNVLPTVDTVANLKKLLEKSNGGRNYAVNDGMMRTLSSAKSMLAMEESVSMDSSVAPQASPEASRLTANDSVAGNGSTGANNDFSKTNVQVQGVDEADIVKTDGEYIYQVNNGEIIITKAYPAQSLAVTSRIRFADNDYEGISPVEMYVDNNQLTVIVTSSKIFKGTSPIAEVDPKLPEYADDTSFSEVEVMGKRIMPPYYGEIYRQFTNVYVYDLTNKEKPEKIKDFSMEGNYISSRKINSNLYVISNKYINVYPVLYRTMEGEATTKAGSTENESLPNECSMLYHDSAVSNELIEKPLSEIRYFPNFKESNYLVIAGADLSKPNEAVNITSYLGAGQTVYASPENLYVAIETYDYAGEDEVVIQSATTEESSSSGSASAKKATVIDGVTGDTMIAPDVVPPFMPGIIMPRQQSQNTLVYKFSLNNGKVTYLSKGEVPGRILNQFSMDEYDKHFRIATTTDEIWSTKGENLSKNNLFILDDSMNISGKIVDIAPGEKIYSVRFMGKRAYIVTFRTVDPLFVIDVSNPQKPEILGKLKIPGYSDYLHPYDENHIIGFGKDTVEGKYSAYYLGMKMAMFDVTDVTNPKQEFVEIIGDRGTDSELLRNHKALLFSKEKNLLVFPVTLMKVQERKDDISDDGMTDSGFVSDAPEYGQFEWQGAYVYSIDAQKGFNLRGKITHLTDEDFMKASTYGFDYERQVNRALYIGDMLYTLSNKVLKANDLADLKEIKSINVREN